MNVLNAIQDALGMGRKPEPLPPAPPGEKPLSSEGPARLAPVDRSELKVTSRQNPKSFRRFEQFGSAPIEQSSVEALIRLAGPGLIPESLRKRIGELDSRYQTTQKFILEHTAAEAIRYAKAQHREITAKILEGRTADAESQTVWTKGELSDEFARKRAAAKQIKRDIVSEATGLLEPITQKLEKVASDLADDLEAEERKRAEEFGCKFIPSLSLATIGQLSWRIREFMPVYVPPAGLLAFFEPK